MTRLCTVTLLLGLTACGNLQWPPSSGPGLSNPPNAASRGAVRQAPQKRTGGMVIVRQGDSLYSLSRRHKVSLRGLIVANNVRPPYRLRPGQRLVLPAPRRHVVRAGDTLYDISRAYGVDVSSLARINRIVPPYRILPGQTLRLPDTISPVFAAARPAPRPSPPRTSRKPPPPNLEQAAASGRVPSGLASVTAPGRVPSGLTQAAASSRAPSGAARGRPETVGQAQEPGKTGRPRPAAAPQTGGRVQLAGAGQGPVLLRAQGGRAAQ